MLELTQFRVGDVVIHPRRREWGDGLVESVQRIVHEGRPAQRVVVRFPNQGRVTLNTAVAALIAKGTQSMDKFTSSGSRSSDRGGWLGALEQDGQSSPLWRLPETLTDPFASPQRRLAAILDSYRFSKEPRSLIEWAIAQTGLADPLTKYTRHELEQGFEGFARNRENHLKELARQLKRQGHLTLLQDALASATSAAVRTALDKAMRG